MCFTGLRDTRTFYDVGYYAVLCLALLSKLDVGAVTQFDICPETCLCIISQSSPSEEKIFKNVVCRKVIRDIRLLHVPQKTEWLDLSRTSLQSIPSYFFIDHGIVMLVELDLTYNNLSYIDQKTFIGLNELKYLDLSYNKILYFEPNSLLYNEMLTHIYMRGTDVPLPEEGSLVVSHTLKVLDVSDCRISSLPTLVFSELPYLLVLNVSTNPITRVNVKILENLTWLRELDVTKTNLRCDQHLAPLTEWAKAYSVRLTGYPCKNSHNEEEVVFRGGRRKQSTLKDDGPEWPNPTSPVGYVNDLEESLVSTMSGSVEPDDSRNDRDDKTEETDAVSPESNSEVIFWAGLLAKVNWTFWLMCLGCFVLGVALTIAGGYFCYSCCRNAEEQPNELVSAGDEFQLVQSEMGYEEPIIPDEPPSYSSLFSSRYQKVLPTPQFRHGQRFNS
ncbi:hypothetical protein GE061_014291 [Apolygus lucorum]|uniref:LRRCT domain-containing protein n=1 Tax=Apolygus lucorum TaxID=248454 RepID=A0A8S9XSW2_APOLU|nr:hypothetical protein GE061_014291 [Apolygus lucorum]